MPTNAVEIAAALFAANPDARHWEMTQWIILTAKVTNPTLYGAVIREYRRLQRSAQEGSSAVMRMVAIP